MSEYFEGMTDPRQEAKVKHSFIETIMIVICAVIAGCDVWEDIADYRIIQGETTAEETYYYISSLEDVREFSIAARSHWGVENSLHWRLDVTFREDHSRMRKDNTAENFAVVRHIVLNILKRMDDKLSVARRRRRCCYDDDYLQKVLLSIHA